MDSLRTREVYSQGPDTSVTGIGLSRLRRVAGLAVAWVTWWVPAHVGQAQPADGAPKLLFRASFDRMTAFADVADGAPESTLEASLELRSKPGVSGSCLVLEDGERCAYAVKGNLRTDAATVSFWVRPANWSDATPRFEKFFRVSDRDFAVHIGKPGDPGLVRAWIRAGAWRTPGKRDFFALGQAKWDADKWHKIDVSWDSTHLAIYVDGRLGSRVDLPNLTIPPLTDRQFELVPIWTQKTRTHDSDDRTFIDEFEIRHGVLSRDRILESYLKQSKELDGGLSPPVMRVPRTGGITLDGKLDEAAWSRAARVPILCEINSSLPFQSQASASVCYDATHLYIGLWSERPGGAKPRAKHKERDGKLWEDDSFEVFLIPSDDPEATYCQFLVNSAGAIYDGRGVDRKWSSNAVVRASIGADNWTAEVSMPFADFGAAAPAPGTVWLANFCRDWPQPAPAKPEWTSWANSGYAQRPDDFGCLVFGGADDGAQLMLASGLETGQLRVRGSAHKASTFSCEVRADKQTVFSRREELPGEKAIEAILKTIKTGVLSATITDSEGVSLVEYRTRFMVREPIAVQLVPDVLKGRLGFQIDFQNLDAPWREAVAAGRASLTVSLSGPSG